MIPTKLIVKNYLHRVIDYHMTFHNENATII
jgi:hypothetical protein